MASIVFADLLGEELQRASGVVSTREALEGKKHVMLYFSAQWCPPCRGFTPVLAAKYQVAAVASDVDIVFISSDQDTDSFDDYYSEMPWLALPFAKRDVKDALSSKYQVCGIPSLIVLDSDGAVVTTEGRVHFEEYLKLSDSVAPECGETPSDSCVFEELFGPELYSKAGMVSTRNVIRNKKFVMIYFSAHWCPPCRGFTPDLAQKYSVCADSRDVEIVFVSSDRDTSSFEQYFESMPWVALPFTSTEVKANLCQAYEVRGIPKLVVLDSSGKLVTTEGRAAVDDYFTPPAVPKPVNVESPFEALFGQQLQSKKGCVSTRDVLIGKAIVLVYFSAHWCPPCRGFTPQLVSKYMESCTSNVEVVFVSSDQDESSFKSYYDQMPWLALPFSNSDVKSRLGQKFNVEGIPSLVVLDSNGDLITTEGRATYERYFPKGNARGASCACTVM